MHNVPYKNNSFCCLYNVHIILQLIHSYLLIYEFVSLLLNITYSMNNKSIIKQL